VRIAWLSPLPPIPSGIADYSLELLPALAQASTVDAVSPTPGHRHLDVPAGVRLVSPRHFDRSAGTYDAVFHHLGNNPHHEFVYHAALRHPGIAVFHDFVLHHLIDWMAFGDRRIRPEIYERVAVIEEGELGDRLASLRRRMLATEFEKFLFPMNRHVAEVAKAIVVHNEDARERIAAVAPGVPVSVIPHNAGSAPAAVRGVDRAEARRRLGLAPDAFLVGHFGFITKPKQPAAVVRGFARLAARRDDALLLMVGSDNTGGGLQRLVARYGLTGRVRIAGFVDLTHFYLYLRAVDAVINLRYPTAGESSGTAARSMAEGRATIVNNLGSFAEIPRGVVLKVEIDADMAEGVGEHLIHLAEEPEFRASVERAALAYAATALDRSRCRDLYLDVARRVSSALDPINPSDASGTPARR
jgi:glycosyltransferase involved in cell wall biosynthesis